MALYGEAGDRLGQAYALNHLGVVQAQTGDYPAALASHERALAIAQDLGDRPAEAVAVRWRNAGVPGRLPGIDRTAAPGLAGRFARRAS